jgi:hypothetical protein
LCYMCCMCYLCYLHSASAAKYSASLYGLMAATTVGFQQAVKGCLVTIRRGPCCARLTLCNMIPTLILVSQSLGHTDGGSGLAV